ncbi:sugar phosphate isomerase/epimerase [Saccharopolyspora sp. HNM0983]|uniref:Sugar phosphate isomerase/epimerase n=1 Tax=Saccharopolyspora montiporae TaxID=2781240 RepID=A0A929B7K1_9PSEU|nr:TIM barrel protein [Saccharopolyspora sp. HNM0983]MBE9373696.1 sugar phosphate isomerase/epimerase [Saccharopolyspora sp. HNM0983]
MPDEAIIPRLAGITDEAAGALTGQIRVITDLGWSGIELRSLGGRALADLPAAEAARARRAITAAGINVVALDSRIGNWARPITAPFADDLAELDALAEWCSVLGTRAVRIMSYPNDGLAEPEWRDRVLDRMHRLAQRARELGLLLLHENCAGWAGRDPERMLQLLDAGDRSALLLLFDTGNGIEHGYSARDLLPRILPHIAHVHVKDATGGPGAASYALPGSGDAQVAECLQELLAAGYDGPLSLEPHLAVRPHEGLHPGESAADLFTTAGRSLEQLLQRLVPTAEPAR